MTENEVQWRMALAQSRVRKGGTFQMEMESPIERAVFGIQLGVADIFIAIQSAQTIDDARNIHRMTQQLTELLLVCECAALDRAEALNP